VFPADRSDERAATVIKSIRQFVASGRRLMSPGRSTGSHDLFQGGTWNYKNKPQFPYGAETSYRRGMAFLDGHGDIEDWGCGTAYAKRFVTKSRYVGIDGVKSRYSDKVADLRAYRSDVDCVFIRHVLEHNYEWRTILENAVGSFKRRMVLIIFTPFADKTRQIATWDSGIPDIGFRKEDLTEVFGHLRYTEEALVTETQYRGEHVFYIEKDS
jgi:hypothetical protein